MLEDTASTNDHVRTLGMAGYPHGLVVLAESQSSGRGRRDHVWHAPPGRDILMTLLLRPPVPVELWSRVTTLAALAICKAVEGATELRPMIKWPNDVYLSDKKCAGILAEMFAEPGGPFMALGIGLNVNADRFPAELAETATSLLMERADRRPLDRNPIVIALLGQIEMLMARMETGFREIVEGARARSWLMGRPITAVVDREDFAGTAVGMDDEGRLLVRDLRGEVVALSSAEQVRRVA